MTLLTIKRLTLPPGAWTAVLSQAPSSSHAIVNVSSQDLKMRSDPSDATTEDILPVNAQQDIGRIAQVDLWQRAPAGQVLIYMQPSTGEAATIVVRCS